MTRTCKDTGVKVIGLKATLTHYVTKPNGLLDPKADPKKEKVVPEAKSGAIEWGSKTEPFNINFAVTFCDGVRDVGVDLLNGSLRQGCVLRRWSHD